MKHKSITSILLVLSMLMSLCIMAVSAEEEEEIFLRGRNAKKGTRSKSATVAEYNRSTGFEAVLGFLYVTGQIERINQLLSLAEEENT